MNDKGELQGGLGTVRNAAQVLELMSNGPPATSPSELAVRSGMPTPTVHRILRSLVLAGFVEQDPATSRYSLGPGLVRLSESYLARRPVLRVASPYLVQLRDSTKATILVGLLIQGAVLYADRLDGDDSTHMYRSNRRLFDAFQTAAGRVLLGHATPGDWDEARARSDEGARFTAKHREAWAAAPYIIESAQPPRFASEVAVPLCDRSGRVLAALAAMGSPLVFTDEVLAEEVAPQLLRAAQAIGLAISDE